MNSQNAIFMGKQLHIIKVLLIIIIIIIISIIIIMFLLTKQTYKPF